MRFNAEPIEIFWLCAGYDEKWINTGFERNAFRVVEGVHWEDGIDSSQEDIKSSFSSGVRYYGIYRKDVEFVQMKEMISNQQAYEILRMEENCHSEIA